MGKILPSQIDFSFFLSFFVLDFSFHKLKVMILITIRHNLGKNWIWLFLKPYCDTLKLGLFQEIACNIESFQIR